MIGCIIQARVGSTRLPRKILMNVANNETALSFIIKQIQYCTTIDKLVIATTELPEDDEILNYLDKFNIEWFRGNSLDVLDRYYQCAKKFSFSTIVRITSDCPLIDPTIVDRTVSQFINNKNNIDYVSNVHPLRTFPKGTDVEVFSFDALATSWKEAEKPSEREHVTPYIYNNKKFKLLTITNPKDLSSLRWTLDYFEDLELIKEIISRIDKRPILMNDIIKLFSENPKLQEINKKVS